MRDERLQGPEELRQLRKLLQAGSKRRDPLQVRQVLRARIIECNPGYGNCDGNIWKNGCEKSLLSDPFNCGKCCKQVPNAVTPCKFGKCCEPECKPGYGNSDGDIWKNRCEKSLTNDIFNCGKCSYCCPVTLKGGEATCSAGVCGQQCKAGTEYDSVSKCCVPIVH